MDIDYKQALEQAQMNLVDIKKRGNDALGDWDDLEKEIFTPEEIAASDLRVSMMVAQSRNN